MGSHSDKFGPEVDLNSFTQAELLAHFDACVDTGVIKFDRSFITRVHTIDGIDFEFRISKALQSKPHETSSPLATTLSTTSVAPRPGSDLRTAGTEIASLGSTHFLALNGFACYRPHYLMLTTDGYRRQWEPLDIDDFTAVHTLLDSDATGSKSGNEEYLIFFNGGPDAGCSRVHKHLQAIPQESYGGDPWKNMDKGVLPFAYFEHHFGQDGEQFGPEATLKAYNKGMEAVKRSIGAPTVADGEKARAPAHTVLMDRERIVVIPRPKSGTGGVAANAAGMLGMIWTSDEASTQKWLDAGPEKVLKVAGVPQLA